MLFKHESHITIYICDGRLIDEQLFKIGTCFYHLQPLGMTDVSAVSETIWLQFLSTPNCLMKKKLILHDYVFLLLF